jgi:hypothetical protein
MPLLYPDLNIPGILFIQRIRSGVFYDYAKGIKNLYSNPDQFHDYGETFNSFGVELITDFYILRIPFMISGGLQTTWKVMNVPPTIELLFNIDIFGKSVGRDRFLKYR